MVFYLGSLSRAVGFAAIVLSAGTAQAQQSFNPFEVFQPRPTPQQQSPRQEAPKQQAPQKAKPAPTVQQSKPQKAQQPAQKAQPAPTGSAPFGEVRSACASELKGTCAGALPGSADSVQCLRRNLSFHSPACQAALNRAGTPAIQPASAPEPATPAPPKGTAEAPRRVTTDRVTATPQESPSDLKVPNLRPTQEARFVSRHCREDHSLFCKGVPFGQVLKCLAVQQASLNKDCRSAIAARR